MNKSISGSNNLFGYYRSLKQRGYRSARIEELEERTLLAVSVLEINGMSYDASINQSNSGIWSWDTTSQTLSLVDYIGGAIAASFESSDTTKLITIDLGSSGTHHFINVIPGTDGLNIDGRIAFTGSDESSLYVYGGIRADGNGTVGIDNITKTADINIYYADTHIDAFANTQAELQNAIDSATGGSGNDTGTQYTVMVANSIQLTSFTRTNNKTVSDIRIDGQRNIMILSSGDWTINASTTTTSSSVICINNYSTDNSTPSVNKASVLSLNSSVSLGTTSLTLTSTTELGGSTARARSVSLVHNSGTFYLYNGVNIVNNINSDSTMYNPGDNAGGVYVAGPWSTTTAYTTSLLTVDSDGNPTGERVSENGTVIASQLNLMAAFYMYGGTISGNISYLHGGGIDSFGIVYINGGTLENNTAYWEGGGIFSRGYVFLNEGAILNNICTRNTSNDYGKGGGIHNSITAYLEMNGGTIYGNRSVRGGGIYAGGNGSATLVINGGSITYNYASGVYTNQANLGDGGGIWANSTVKIYGGKIAYNYTLNNIGNGIYIQPADSSSAIRDPLIYIGGSGSVSTSNKVYIGSITQIHDKPSGIPLIPIRVESTLTTVGSIMYISLASSLASSMKEGFPLIYFESGLDVVESKFTLDSTDWEFCISTGEYNNGTITDYKTQFGALPDSISNGTVIEDNAAYAQMLVFHLITNNNAYSIRIGDLFFTTRDNAFEWIETYYINGTESMMTPWIYTNYYLAEVGSSVDNPLILNMIHNTSSTQIDKVKNHLMIRSETESTKNSIMSIIGSAPTDYSYFLFSGTEASRTGSVVAMTSSFTWSDEGDFEMSINHAAVIPMDSSALVTVNANSSLTLGENTIDSGYLTINANYQYAKQGAYYLVEGSLDAPGQLIINSKTTVKNNRNSYSEAINLNRMAGCVVVTGYGELTLRGTIQECLGTTAGAIVINSSNATVTIDGGKILGCNSGIASFNGQIISGTVSGAGAIWNASGDITNEGKVWFYLDTDTTHSSPIYSELAGNVHQGDTFTISSGSHAGTYVISVDTSDNITFVRQGDSSITGIGVTTNGGTLYIPWDKATIELPKSLIPDNEVTWFYYADGSYMGSKFGPVVTGDTVTFYNYGTNVYVTYTVTNNSGIITITGSDSSSGTGQISPVEYSLWGTGGTITINGTAMITENNGRYGGIFNTGTINMNGGTFIDNTNNIVSSTSDVNSDSITLTGGNITVVTSGTNKTITIIDTYASVIGSNGRTYPVIESRSDSQVAGIITIGSYKYKYNSATLVFTYNQTTPNLSSAVITVDTANTTVPDITTAIAIISATGINTEPIRDNIAIWQSGILNMSGSAYINDSNIVYLDECQVFTITGELNTSTYTNAGSSLSYDSWSMEPMTILYIVDMTGVPSDQNITEATALMESGILQHIRTNAVVQDVNRTTSVLTPNIVISYATLTYWENFDSSDTVSYQDPTTYLGGDVVSTMTYFQVMTASGGDFMIKNNYAFIGWNSKQDGTGTWYHPGEALSENITLTSLSTILYAQWSNTYLSTLDDEIVTGDGYRSLREALIISQYSNDFFDHFITIQTDYTKWEQYSGNTGDNKSGQEWTWAFPTNLTVYLSSTYSGLNQALTTNSLADITAVMNEYTGIIGGITRYAAKSTIFTNGSLVYGFYGDTVTGSTLQEISVDKLDGTSLTCYVINTNGEITLYSDSTGTNKVANGTAWTDTTLFLENENNENYTFAGSVSGAVVLDNVVAVGNATCQITTAITGGFNYTSYYGITGMTAVTTGLNLDTYDLIVQTLTGTGLYYSGSVTLFTNTNGLTIGYVENAVTTSGSITLKGNSTSYYVTVSGSTITLWTDSTQTTKLASGKVYSDETLFFATDDTDQTAPIQKKSGEVTDNESIIFDNLVQCTIAIDTSGNITFSSNSDTRTHNIIIDAGQESITTETGFRHLVLSVTNDILSNPVKISGLHFINGREKNGGSIYISAGNITFESCNFYDNTAYTSNSYATGATGNGGAIANMGGTLTLASYSSVEISDFNTNISNQTNPDRINARLGGAIFNTSTCSITDSYCSWLNVSWCGGALYNKYIGTLNSDGLLDGTLASMSITNSTIFHNTADYGGGIANYGIMTIEKSKTSSSSLLNTILYNQANYNGGGILNGYMLTTTGIQNSLTIGDISISHNNALGNGTSDIKILNGGFGGGVINGSIMTIQGTIFSQNNATINGGGISNTRASSVYGTGFSTEAYGVLLIQDNENSVYTIFNLNTATECGGGIGNWGHLTIQGQTSFVSNTAALGDQIYNAGIYTSNTNAIVPAALVNTNSIISVFASALSTRQISEFASMNDNIDLLVKFEDEDYENLGPANSITPASLNLEEGTHYFSCILAADSVKTEEIPFYITILPETKNEENSASVSVNKSSYYDDTVVKLNITANFSEKNRSGYRWTIHWGDEKMDCYDGDANILFNQSNSISLLHYYLPQNETKVYDITLEILDCIGEGGEHFYYLGSHQVPASLLNNEIFSINSIQECTISEMVSSSSVVSRDLDIFTREIGVIYNRHLFQNDITRMISRKDIIDNIYNSDAENFLRSEQNTLINIWEQYPEEASSILDLPEIDFMTKDVSDYYENIFEEYFPDIFKRTL